MSAARWPITASARSRSWSSGRPEERPSVADSSRQAPGRPGIPARWTSSAKSGIGTALNPISRVWFTLSHGILNEIYFPRIDRACTRDFGLIVTGGQGFFSEEKRDTLARVEPFAPGVPAYHLENTCGEGRYRIDKDVVADPGRHVIWQRIRFTPLQGTLADYRLFALLAPHLGNQGAGNSAWVGDYKGTPMLFAQRDALALALASSAPWAGRSVGFVGQSDGWQELRRHGRLVETWDRADDGNVALTGEIDLAACGGEVLLVLGFDTNAHEAGQLVLRSLYDGFERARDAYVAEWRQWLDGLVPFDGMSDRRRELNHISAMVFKVHESKPLPGGLIASLSIPWGNAKGDQDLGGYHLAWPRDLVESAGGLLAVGAVRHVRDVLEFLRVTQEADGHWPQNMWLDGTPYWNGVQMDETAFPILLVDLAEREGAISHEEARAHWPMVRKAAAFIVQNGPVSQQDRWEEDPGYSPFTLAAEIAALLVAADLAADCGEPEVAAYLTETADAWNDGIERWIYACDTPLSRQHGVEGYYVRIGSVDGACASSPLHGFVPIKNRPPDDSEAEADVVVSPDALALVRFGLRAADDPRIVNTVKVIDALLKVETPNGPAWHRYNNDGYGEHADGRPFDGTGIGRAWPLLTGERAHYELAAGRPAEADRLLRAIEAFAGDCGLLPEQVWDVDAILDRELFPGQASGSARPLVWAHAEYVKACRSLADGRIFDQPPQTVQRYLSGRPLEASRIVWRFNHKVRTLPAGRTLRLQTPARALVHWGLDDWRDVQDVPTRDVGLGVHSVDLPTGALAAGRRVVFTFYWPEDDKWEGEDFTVTVGE
ncbi:MAG: glucan 1,4-alpha-glucosidase [Acidobacteriota bacterium]|nr:glucan 1,4-alpha-glucosidase [Acidobacteriota bacterium]